MSSSLELTLSVTKLCAVEAPPLPNRTLSQSSPATVGSFSALPSSSNRPAGSGRPLAVPPSLPNTSGGTTALTTIVTVAPAGRLASVAVRKSVGLTDAASNVLDATPQVSRSASGNWSVTETLVAGPAPVLETVMVNDAVSPGWIVWTPSVMALEMFSSGRSVTLVEAL